jgi:hypothetical protein
LFSFYINKLRRFSIVEKSMHRGKNITSAPEPMLVRQIALHEAGHYVVGRVVRFMMGDIELRFDDSQGHHHGTTTIYLYENLRGREEVLDYLRRRVMQLYAGVWAQSLTEGGDVDEGEAYSFCVRGGLNDERLAREHMFTIRNLLHAIPHSRKECENQHDDIYFPLWKESGDLVKQYAKIIIAIADFSRTLVKEFGTTYTIKAVDIEAIPEVKACFVTLEDATMNYKGTVPQLLSAKDQLP